jgi:hypothetical protein
MACERIGTGRDVVHAEGETDRLIQTDADLDAVGGCRVSMVLNLDGAATDGEDCATPICAIPGLDNRETQTIMIEGEGAIEVFGDEDDTQFFEERAC